MVLCAPDGEWRAILPIARRRVRFRHMSVTALTWAAGELGDPDHLDVLAAPDADLDEFVPVLETMPWDVLMLDNLAPEAPNAARLCAAVARRGAAPRQRSASSCPYLELPRSWEEYLSTLPATRRQTLRRKERNLHRDHVVTLTDYGPERLQEGWRWLTALHERRWEGAAIFRDPRVERLHRTFARDMANSGQLWLTTLDLDGTPAAAWYGFAMRDTISFYQSGRDPGWEHKSVGRVLMGMMIRRAIEQGYRRFDFLRGEEPYKLQWTETRRSTRETVVFRPGWRSAPLRALDWAAETRASLRARA